MRRVVFDLEADGLMPEVTQVWCCVAQDVDTGEEFIFEPHQIQEMLSFLSSCKELIGHNIVEYDIPVLEKLYGFSYDGGVFDSLIVSRLQRAKRVKPPGCKAGPHSVEAWGMRFGRGKPEHEDWSQYSPEMLHRCREDVEIQKMIYNYLLEEGKDHNWATARKAAFKFFEVMGKQEQYGWLMDEEKIHSGIHMLDHWVRKIEAFVVPTIPKVREVAKEKQWHDKPFTQAGKYKAHTINWMESVGLTPDDRPIGGSFTPVLYRDIDLGKQVEVKRYLLSQGWRPREWNTNDAGERTSPKLRHDDPFEGLVDKKARLIARRIQIIHRRGMLTGFLRDMGEDKRLRQSISGIAATGRLTHRVIVNVPGSDKFFGKFIRKCFICKPGYVIIGTDSAACQNRMLAARVGDANFTNTILNGVKEKGTAIHQVNQKNIKDIAGYEVSYKDSKNLNYAFMFGASDNKLGSIIGRDQQAGLRVREALLAIAPGFADLVEAITREWRANAQVRTSKWGKPEYYNGWVTGVDGRPVFIESEHTLLVYMLQSDEAILMQYALLYLYKWCTQRGWVHGREYGFCANIHDEFQAEVREDIAEEFAALAEKSITTAGEYLKIACPHVGEADTGRNWYETH